MTMNEHGDNRWPEEASEEETSPLTWDDYGNCRHVLNFMALAELKSLFRKRSHHPPYSTATVHLHQPLF